MDDSFALYTSANESDCSFRSCDSDLGDSPSLASELLKAYADCTKTFNVCHINAQSVPSHYDELLATFDTDFIHAVLISETWLKPSLPSSTYSLPGFVLIRNDRLGKGGGGVGVYLRGSIPYKIIAASSSTYSGSLEYIVLEVLVSGVKAVLGVVYCPPGVDYFSHFESLLETLATDYAHHIIMGDFNTCLLKNDARSSKLLNIINSTNFNVLPSKPTHHNKDTSDTLLDLSLTSSPSHVYKHGQLSAPGFSHHDLIFMSYKIKPPKPNAPLLHLRSLTKINNDKFNDDASKIDWTAVYVSNDINDKVKQFNTKVITLFDSHAPVHPVRLKRPPAPWITRGVRMAMRRRNRAFRRFKRDRTDENWTLFKAARNRCNQMCRNAKRRHIQYNLSNSSASNIWNFLKTLGICKSQSSFDFSSSSLNSLNQHFSSTSSLDSLTKTKTISFISSLPKCDVTPFEIRTVSEFQVRKQFMSINSRAVGPDEISRKMLLMILDYILPVVTHMINFSLTSNTFPCVWREAFVRPIPKIPLPLSPNHFRPICILPYISKIVESLVLKQLSEHILMNNLLSPYQSGFRSGHSTTTALLKVTEDIRSNMEKTKLTILVLIDFSNAFNTIDFDILLGVLSLFNVSSPALNWFSSYLRGRKQAIRIDNVLSDWCDLAAGVPQGGILSPLLFSVFINLVTSHLSCSYHLYADDLQLYFESSVEDIDTAIALLNENLSLILEWSTKFGIAVNPSKCQATIIGSSRQLSRLNYPVSPLIFDGNVIDTVKNVKNLGLHIDNQLSWTTQVALVSRKVFASLHSLNKLKHFLPVPTKIILAQSLLVPIIDYADSCYLDLNQNLLDKLERCLNNCIRFIFNLRKFDHVSFFRSKLNWLPIRQRRKFRLLCLLYSVLYESKSPPYLKSLFNFLSSTHNRDLRSANNLSLDIPLHRTEFLSQSFTVQAARLWNDLPVNLRIAPNRFAFKKMLRVHLLQ